MGELVVTQQQEQGGRERGREDWVCCDGCGKWRRVPEEFVASLDDDAPWFCWDNPDVAFNSCETPQEFTDEEIDAIQNREHAQATNGYVRGKKRPAVWQLIRTNLYPHRSKKQQDEDEIMVCQCKDSDEDPCGEHCLNRMLNIECVEKYCPNGSRCLNRAFSQRRYASLEVRRAGKKGFGLYAKEDLKAGQFIVEYVGEVLDEEEYMRRKQFYEASHQRHYYFMNIGNGEVVDATRKGGFGRFINHSCSPNCETQKWVVQGELCIGLFTLVDVPAGTELTFDYNFERYGDKPVKCLCGSAQCRGLIGGEKETSESVGVTITATEEEEDLEPIMVTENEEDDTLGDILDRVIGLGWEDGWTPSLQKKLENLAESRGLTLPAYKGPANGPSVDDESFLRAAAESAFSAVPESARRAKSRFSSKTQRSNMHDPDWKDPGDVEQQVKKGARKRQPATSTVTKGAGTVVQNRTFVPRSEVQRRLESMIGKSGRLKETGSKSVVQFLRLFNLCDLGTTVMEGKTEGETLNGDFKGKDGATHKNPEREITRQRARIVDISLLIDVIIRTDGLTAKHKFVELGLLRQLVPIMIHKTGSLEGEHVVIIRKALKAIEMLPFSADVVTRTRSAHGTFEDILKALASHTDYEIRNKSWVLLKKWSLSLDSVKSNRSYNDAQGRAGRYRSHGSSTFSPLHSNRTPSMNREQYGGYRQQSNDSMRSHEFSSYSTERSRSNGHRGYHEGKKRERPETESLGKKRSRWDEKKEEQILPPPAPELSPMTDEEEPEEGILTEEKKEVQGTIKKVDETKKPDILASAALELISDPFDGASAKSALQMKVVGTEKKTWKYPNEDFEKFVINVIRSRLSKYEKPGHPLQLKRDQAATLFSKIRKDIMIREKAAYKERESTGMRKPIEKEKTEARIKSYVKDRVQRFLAQEK